MELKIEKGIPLPRPRLRRGAVEKTLRSMKVGDSVFFTDGKEMHQFENLAYRLKIRIARRVSDGGYRIWRIEEKKD